MLLNFSPYILRVFPYSILLLVFFSCKTYQIDSLPNEQIVFGNGGGITGATTSYILLKNGQVFKINSLKRDTTKLAKIKPSAAKPYFEQMIHLDWEKMAINQPGNTYQFIAYTTSENSYRATWGASNYEPPVALKSIYTSLRQEIIKE